MMKEIMKSWRSGDLKPIKESSFTKTRRSMLGLRSSISTLAFLTAENPQGQKIPDKENAARNKKLEQTLKSMNLGFRKIKGKFGSEENSFMIMNISRDEAVSLGSNFDQESVIWGQKKETEGGVHFSFEYIEGSDTIQTRDVSLGGQEVQKRDDHYSEVSGEKFVIPFFDEEYEDVVYSLEEYRIRTDELLTKVNRRVEMTMEHRRAEKSVWHHRGVLKEMMAANKLLEGSFEPYKTNGTVKLYHFTKKGDFYPAGTEKTLDPEFFLTHRQSYSRNDYNISSVPRVFFYVDLNHKESMFSKHSHDLYSVEVPADEIYDLEMDPEGLLKKSISRYATTPDYDVVLKSLKDPNTYRSIRGPGDKAYKGVYYKLPNMSVVVWFDLITATKED